MKKLFFPFIICILAILGCNEKNKTTKQLPVVPPVADSKAAVSPPPVVANQPVLKEYSAEIKLVGKLETLKPEQKIMLPVVVKNTSQENWLPSPNMLAETEAEYPNLPIGPIAVCYHWLNENGTKDVVYQGYRTFFPKGLQAGAQIEMKALIKAPPQPGKYILRLTLIQNRIAWFENKGMIPLDLLVTVQ